MKNTILYCAVLIATLAFTGAGVAAPLTINKSDSVAAILAAQKGNRVTVKLQSGEELSGKVVTVGDAVVQLGELAGKEFFDAVIPLGSITAVVVRVRD